MAESDISDSDDIGSLEVRSDNEAESESESESEIINELPRLRLLFHSPGRPSQVGYPFLSVLDFL